MAGVLTVEAWLGGPDQVKVESTFPSSSKTYAYNFAQNVSGWTFDLKAQTVIVDQISYTIDRATNSSAPNFANSTIIGFYAEQQISTSTYISVASASQGLVNVTHPPGLYTGPILPDARANTPITIVSFTWTIPNYVINGVTVPQQINSHRIAKIMAWEPPVTPGNPANTATGYTAIV